MASPTCATAADGAGRRNRRPAPHVLPIMIRTATQDDLDAIVALHTEARATYYSGHLAEEEYAGRAEVSRSRDGWARAVDREDATVLVAERDGAVVGIAAHSVHDGWTYLTQLHVSPAHWREGIGSALHLACLADWQRRGVTRARLEVFEPNRRAQAFYSACGWAADPETPRNDDHLVLRLAVPQAPGRG
ncbi:GNAT family N-acetyltransferase [Streptomyces sp. OfavH-34-F]|uniref:GNAT family N-acetyltransferase n=1 Tax=Streptomyces sp. OfavH-34-F TaxID=2917760 RepID=UPI0027E4476A|nr:GNAT family N-acetyltransferase [Streptomyces sp. OfavH-34-F]